jgi:hypothetical protein
MKRISICTFLLIGALTTGSTFAQSERAKANQKADKILLRSQRIPTTDYSLWHNALSAVSAVYSVKEGEINDVALLVFVSDLWKNDEFQKDVSDKLLPRISVLPKSSYDEWSAALEKYSGEYVRNSMYALCLLIQRDRLFDGDKFSSKGSKILLKRLESVPKQAIAKWFKETDPLLMGGEAESALSIIERDEFFQNDVFQEVPFTKKLKELASTANNP